ncbi:hypothetical protein CRG98_021862 [Punica granatum]|uniref:Uncharacterized protein n=1 Tax=Punica granatum TaxID=22663 RepID=A0A2I0JND7_PUNGR|nr:hypothetical protein CRG98_021862 [Punica granatum]
MPERDVISWNTAIGVFSINGLYLDAVGLFQDMISASGLSPNLVSVISVLPVCATVEDEKMTSQIHGYMIKTGLDVIVTAGNALVDAYGKCGSMKAAKRVFNEMTERSEVSWNAIITSFAYRELHGDALSTFRLMILEGLTPNTVTISSMLPVLVELEFFNLAKELHGFSMRRGIESDIFIANSLIDMYAKSGHPTEASCVFNKMTRRNVVSWNAMVANFAQNRFEFKALNLIREMQNHVGYSQTSECIESLILFWEMQLTGMKHDVVSFVGAISACANLAALKQGREIHGIVVRKLSHEHLFVANSLLDLYTKCGRIDIAKTAFDRIPIRDVASWNTMILGYGMLGELDVAISLFEAMKYDGVEYDSVSYIAILSACSHGGLVERGRNYFNEMQGRNVKPTTMHYACMVDLLGRAGLMDEAVNLIKDISVEPDANVWGALLGACRLHGSIELGCWAADHLFKLKPNHCGYYALLSNMYAEAGRWDDADRVRELMKSRRVKKDPGFSWVQIRDQVHAFVVGEKLENLDTMYCPGECGW